MKTATVPTVDPEAVLYVHRLHRADASRWRVDCCPHCLEPWQGDPETGGCSTRLLAREVLRLRAALDGAARHIGDRALRERLLAVLAGGEGDAE